MVPLSEQQPTPEMVSEVTTLIGRYLGEEAARLYREYYQTQSTELVYVSISELLSEVVGESRAEVLVAEIRGKYAG